MEVGTIGRLIDQLRQHLPNAHILVVDDQSPDGTAELVRQQYAGVPTVEVVLRPGPRGFGAAMREGIERFLASPAEHLITIDADLSHDPALTTRMLERLAPSGVVIGSRYMHGAPRADWAVARMLISILGNRYVRRITGLPIADCTSGFRCYTRSALESIDRAGLRARGFAFQVETLYRLWRAGCPVAEVPIVYRDRLVGESKLDGAVIAESLLVPWRLRWRGGAATGQRRAAPPAAPEAAAPRTARTRS